jgi:DNA recombination protein RmuC
MMALRTIGTVWRAHRRTSNAEQIARRAGLLFDKFVGFVDELNEVGKSISAAGSAYDDAMKKLSTGKGNLVGQVSKLKLLGATTTKALPIDVEDDQPTMATASGPGTAALT